MKIITIEGSYGIEKEVENSGLIALCQFETFDSKKQIEDAKKTLIKISNERKIIMVPFAHISNDVKEYKEAELLFNLLVQSIKEQKGEQLIAAPFGGEKGLYISSEKGSRIKLYVYEHHEKERIKALYSEYALIFDEHMESTGHYRAQRRLIGLLMEYVKEPIIDLGAGTGYLCSVLMEHGEISKIYVNDISKTMIQRAQDRLNEKTVYFSNFDAEEISVKDRFKTIISCNLFFYLCDPVNAINNWNKILELDGSIMLLEEHPFLYPRSMKNINYVNELMKIHRYFKPKEIIEMFKYQGMCLVKEVEVEIDANHNLKGYVFKKQPTAL